MSDLSPHRMVRQAPVRDRREPSSLPVTLLRAWRSRFANRPQPYAVQQPDGTYRWIHGPCELEDLAAHLEGEWTLALSSTDRRARCKWLCLDADAVGSDIISQLVALRAALAVLDLPGFVEASRRGGHLWFLLDHAMPARAARGVLTAALSQLQADGIALPAHELYPTALEPGMLGQAVRLPLGIHQLTDKRYPLFDADGLPCAFTSTRSAVQFVLEQPRVSSELVTARCQERTAHQGDAAAADAEGDAEASSSRIGTHSPVIRWVDRHVSPLELLDELAPDTELQKVGKGYLGWCPFHDDRAPDAAGRLGTPSFYVVHDRVYGWSWKCFSTNCPYSWGMMRHPFELYQRLLDLSVRAAIVEACARWPEADPTAAPGADCTPRSSVQTDKEKF
jgi:hypothetical protein